MSEIHLLSAEERRLFFEKAVIESGIPFSIIEKDFWVVWTLERMFSVRELKPHLTFKGGTSLSKVFKVINRFSEDIDLSIEKTFFRFDKENDPEKAGSRKKREAALKDLSAACSEYVQKKMCDLLAESIANRIGKTDGWRLYVDAEDPDGQTLQFEYPSITASGG